MSAGVAYRQVSCHYRGGARAAALEELNLECAEGTLTSLVGPNGAGKSTALALAAGLLPASRGEVSRGGQTVRPGETPRGLGYLPQQSGFPSGLRARGVLDFVGRARGSSADQQRRVTELLRLGPVLDRNVSTLSSGWVRRLGLAAALSEPSEVILLDEPFVGLDLEVLTPVIEQLCQRVERGCTVVLSSHDFEVIDRLGGRVAVIDQGHLLGCETRPERPSRDTYRRLVGVRSATPQPTAETSREG